MPRDRQAVSVATGQPYGAAGQQAQAEKALPMPNPGAATPVPTAPPPSAAPTPGPAPAPGPAGPQPVVPLHAPTQLPGQPVTAGLASGPGAGPEVMGNLSDNGNLQAALRGVFAQHPEEDLRGLIEQLQTTRGTT